MVIKHNMLAMNANRNLGITTKQSATLTERLSSGFRINRAADDAAGLSISEKMRKQIRGLTQASANAQDGISLVQTADGALNEVQDMLHRGNELAVKAANGTLSEDDRKYIQEEINELRKEISRVGSTTKFNEVHLFNSQGTKQATQTYGAVELSESVTFDELATRTGDKFNAEKLEKLANQIKGDVPKLMGQIISKLDALKDPSTTADGAGLKLGLNFINADNDTLAFVTSNGTSFGLTVNLHYIKETINGSDSVFGSNKFINSDGKDRLNSTLTHELTHALMLDSLTAGMTGYNEHDKFPDWFIEGMAQTTAGASDYVVGKIKGLTSDSTKEEWLSHLRDGGYASYAQGYIACMQLGYAASGGTDFTSAAIAEGLNKILTDVKYGYSLSEAISRNTDYGGLEDFENRFTVDGKSTIDQYIKAVGVGKGSIITGSLKDGHDQLAGTEIKDYFTLTLDDTYPYNDIPTMITGGGATTGGTNRTGTINADAAKKFIGVITGGGVAGSLTAQAAQTISLQVGADGTLDNRMEIELFDISALSLGLYQVNVTTQEGATKAIDIFGQGIQQISEIRSYYGAIQNRLEHTINNLDNVVENTQAAESAIRDTDMAALMVEYSKQNILMQAGQSMLAQANQSNQGVLSLLG